MGAFEFWAQVSPDRTLEVPAEVADQLPEGQAVRVILLVPDADDDEEEQAWARLAAEQLFRAYADEDGIYDDVDLSGAVTR